MTPALACHHDPGADVGGDTGGEACSLELECPSASVCTDGECVPTGGRRPYRDTWRTELTLPAAAFERLRIGGRAVADNFINTPALPGTGILVDLRAGACASIEHAEQPADYFGGAAVDVRGELRVCSGCLP